MDSIALQEIAREDLKRYKNARRDIDHIREMLERQQAKAERTTKPLDPEWVPVQRANPGPEELLCLVADLQIEYYKKQIIAERICNEIEQRISDSTFGVEQRILRKHYLIGIKLKEITDEDYSTVQIKRLHRRALEHYGKKMIPNDPF